jgi:citrate lyase subunit beta/citryl-CoA lyase
VDKLSGFNKNREMLNVSDLRLCRTLLFLPASNPRAIEKARDLAADMIVLDLEDAVKPESKEIARDAAVAAVRQGFGPRLVAVRVNVPGSDWYEADAAALRGSGLAFVILPKAESEEQIRDLSVRVDMPVLAMIETARGVQAAAEVARGAAGLIAGTNDLSADLAIPPGSGRAGLALGLQTVVLAARAAGIAAFDGVYNRLEDDEGLEAECREGRAFGFDGKSLIHPGQIATANRIFGPSEAELEVAERLLAAATGGAERFEGQMIETLHVEQARALLARARRLD